MRCLLVLRISLTAFYQLEKFRTTKFDLKKLETLFYRTVQSMFRYLEPFRRKSTLTLSLNLQTMYLSSIPVWT